MGIRIILLSLSPVSLVDCRLNDEQSRKYTSRREILPDLRFL